MIAAAALSLVAGAVPASAAGGYTVTATIAVGSSPYGVAADPAAGTVYVANASDNTVSVINTATGTVAATITVGSYPEGVAADPAAGTVYVTNYSDGTVSVINTATNTVTATIAVGNYPNGVAVDPSTHAAYVANGSDDTVSVISPALPVPVTTVTSSQDPSTFGQKVTFTATIAPADGGTLTFTNGTTVLCNAVPLTHAGGSTYKAKCATTAAALPAGFNTITAAYPGDTRYAPSAGTLTQTVAQAPRTPAPPAPPPARDRRPDPAGRKRRRTYQGQLPRNRQLPALIGNHDPAVTAAALQGQPARSTALWAR